MNVAERMRRFTRNPVCGTKSVLIGLAAALGASGLRFVRWLNRQSGWFDARAC